MINRGGGGVKLILELKQKNMRMFLRFHRFLGPKIITAKNCSHELFQVFEFVQGGGKMFRKRQPVVKRRVCLILYRRTWEFVPIYMVVFLPYILVKKHLYLIKIKKNSPFKP